MMQAHAIRSPRLALLATSLGFAIICLDVTVVNVALRRIQQTLASDSAQLEWVLNAYTLAFASLLLSAGALGDRLGARRVFVAGFAVFTLASLACGLTSSAVALIAARTAQGVGAALCVPSSLSLLSAVFPDAKSRAKAVSIWAGTAALALGAGPLMGGLLVSLFGWRSIFLINLPFGALGIWLTLAYAPDTLRNPARQLDPAGQLSAAAALVALTFAVVEGGRYGWASPRVLTSIAGFVVFGLVFVLVERHQRQPMLPLSLLRIPAVIASSFTGMALSFGYYGLMFAMSLFFQRVWHYSPLATGLAFLPMTAVVTVANLVSGALTARFGHRLPMVLGQALAAVGFFSLGWIGSGTAYLMITGPLLAIGVGVALAVPSINTAVLAHVDAGFTGIASGVLNTARQIGGALGVGVFGALVSGAEDGMIRGLRVAVIVAGVLMLAGVGVAVGVLKADELFGATAHRFARKN
jgi:MFS transporter, DHA2 family, methylenomycin A resistance protein